MPTSSYLHPPYRGVKRSSQFDSYLSLFSMTYKDEVTLAVHK